MMPQAPAAARHVFVYGTLRRGGLNDIARFRPAPGYVGEATIAATLYDLGAYPGAVLGGAGRVRGEVYLIVPSVEAELDALEEVNDQGTGEYVRRHVVVEVAGRRIPCLVYEIQRERRVAAPVIAGGDWMVHRAA